MAEPFPPAWQKILDDVVRHYRLLSEADQQRLRAAVQIIVAEKRWEGCRGVQVTDEMRVVIAALAGILVLRMPGYYFDQVYTVLIYPEEYVVPEEAPLAGEIVLHRESERLGEAHHRGPVIVSWSDVHSAALEPGHGENLVFHEFAHRLDELNGAFDGTPRLAGRALRERWSTVMNREYQRLIRAAERGRHTLLDPYGATDPAEFFAVTTECFFDAPRALREELPELYALCRDYYQQDPAAWPGW